MPEVIAWPEGDPDYSPTARHNKPDECPNTNVPAHGRCPLLKTLSGSKMMHKPGDAGHPSTDGGSRHQCALSVQGLYRANGSQILRNQTLEFLQSDAALDPGVQCKRVTQRI